MIKISHFMMKDIGLNAFQWDIDEEMEEELM